MGTCEWCAKSDHDNCVACSCSCRNDSYIAAQAVGDKLNKKHGGSVKIYVGEKFIDGLKMYSDRTDKGWWIEVGNERRFMPFSQHWIY